MPPPIYDLPTSHPHAPHLFAIDVDVAEGVDCDQYISDVGVDLAGPVALLQLRHDHLLRQTLQRGQVVDEHGRQLGLPAGLEAALLGGGVGPPGGVGAATPCLTPGDQQAPERAADLPTMERPSTR